MGSSTSIYGYGVGDVIRSNSGVTAVVHHIDPACNNVFVFRESNSADPANIRELSMPRSWSKAEAERVTLADQDAVGSAALDFGGEIAELTIYRDRTGGNLLSATVGQFPIEFARRIRVNSYEGGYQASLQNAIKAKAADLPVDADFVAVGIYGDGETCVFKFTTRKAPQPVEVKFS